MIPDPPPAGTRGYEIHFQNDDPRVVRVSCPSLPELVAQGADKAAALENANRALDGVIANRVRRNQDVPPFDRVGGGHQVVVTLRAIHVLKLQLYQAMRRNDWTRAELSRRLNWHRNQLDRLFDFGHASRLDQIEDAASVLKLRLDTTLTDNVTGMSVQTLRDGDGWRVRLATEDPSYAGAMLTPVALEHEDDARRIADAVKRALDLLAPHLEIKSI